MDTAERAVFRRKRPLMAQILNFGIPMQKKYMEYGLLKDDMFQDILPEQSDRGQMMRFLDQVMKSRETEFSSVQHFLRDQGHSWVADEMAIDLLAEKGELDIEEYIDNESQMIVHKVFGQSKRISEKDKRDISYMLALRYQAAKESIQTQLKSVIFERDEALQFKWEESGKLKALSEKIQTFLKIQKIRLNEHVNSSAPSDLTREDPDPHNKNLEYMMFLEENVDNILETLARVILEKEKVATERKKCLKILGVPRANVGLDLAIENALRNAADDIEKSRREVDLTDQLAQELDTELKNTKVVTNSEMAAKDRQIQYLDTQVKKNKEKCLDLEAEVRRLRAELAEAKDTIEKANKRSEALGKTRRLGYYHPGWVEKTYDEHGLITTDLSEKQALVPVDDIKPDTEAKKKGETKSKPDTKTRSGVNGRTLTKSRSGELKMGGGPAKPINKSAKK